MGEPGSEQLTRHYNEDQIQFLHQQFIQIRNFRERLEFFDLHFGLLPYPFPEFKPELPMFFDAAGLDELNNLFNTERRHSFVAERRFQFNGNHYLFRILPFNTYPQVQNEYILHKFLSNDKSFARLVTEAAFLKQSSENNFLEKKHVAENALADIRHLLESGEEQSFRSRYMTVFYAGYTDETNNMIKKFRIKKKFIELFLYAQGMLFRKYQDFLGILSGRHTTHHVTDDYRLFDWTTRISLFKELGIIELLKQKYGDRDHQGEDKLAHMICLMLGQDVTLAENVKHYIR